MNGCLKLGGGGVGGGGGGGSSDDGRGGGGGGGRFPCFVLMCLCKPSGQL